MLLEMQIDLHERTPLGLLGFTDQVHTGFMRRAVALARVTADAGANNVLPRRRPAAVARNYMVEV